MKLKEKGVNSMHNDVWGVRINISQEDDNFLLGPLPQKIILRTDHTFNLKIFVLLV
jgi:hypothetical protein